MNKKSKFALLGIGLVLGVGILSSCTASFCSIEDTARILYTHDKGVTRLSDEDFIQINALDEETKVTGLTTVTIDKLPTLTVYKYSSFDNSKIVRETLYNSMTNGAYFKPSLAFFEQIDLWTVDIALDKFVADGGDLSSIKEVGPTYVEAPNFDADHPMYIANNNLETLNGVLNSYGHVKFLDNTLTADQNKEDAVLYTSLKGKINEMRNAEIAAGTTLTVPGNDFVNSYISVLTNATVNSRSCIVTTDGDAKYGMYGDKVYDGYYEQITVTSKDWGYAFGTGFLEGLLIYPISYVVDSMTVAFAGGSTTNLISSNGWAQVGAIILITLLVRSIMLLITLKPTVGQQKMQRLQPELNKLNEKYPNAQTNTIEKQMLAQEQSAIYKKHKINPITQILVMVLQFPIFICVWGALSGSAPLSTGNFYNMNLSTTIWNVISNFDGLPGNVNGWRTAFTIILLMIITQATSMLLPQILQKVRAKKAQRNNNVLPVKQNSTQKGMKWMQYIMLIVIIVMGFTLPSAMAIYWIVGAVFSVCQTTVFHFIFGRNKNKKDDNDIIDAAETKKKKKYQKYKEVN